MHLAILENLVRLAHQEETEVLGQWVCQGQRVTQELLAQEHQENQERVVHQVHLDLWGPRVHMVNLVSQALLECQVLANPVNLEYQVVEDPLALQEPLVRKESQAPLVLLASQVLQDLLAQLVHREQEDSRARQEPKDQKATLVWSVHQAQEEPKVSQELRASLENQVPLG